LDGAFSFRPDRRRRSSPIVADSRVDSPSRPSPPPPTAPETRLLCALAERGAARARAELSGSRRRFRAACKKCRRAYVRGIFSLPFHSPGRLLSAARTFTKRRHFVRDVPHTRENGGRRDVGGHQSSRTRSIRSRETSPTTVSRRGLIGGLNRRFARPGAPRRTNVDDVEIKRDHRLSVAR